MYNALTFPVLSPIVVLRSSGPMRQALLQNTNFLTTCNLLTRSALFLAETTMFCARKTYQYLWSVVYCLYGNTAYITITGSRYQVEQYLVFDIPGIYICICMLYHAYAWGVPSTRPVSCQIPLSTLLSYTYLLGYPWYDSWYDTSYLVRFYE